MKVLIAEDEHRIAHAIKKGLEQERYLVDLAYTGGEAIDLATTEEFDLILLDVMLPEIDGLHVCRTLRQKKIHTPILMLTAKEQLEDKVAGLDSGADDYLTKPFSFEELLARIRALLRRPSPFRTQELKVLNLTLDPQLYIVKRDENVIMLSHKEFTLLEYFMRHEHQVLTKETLISHVWDYDADILPNTVEVTIRNLRKKIDLAFPDKPPLLHTVRGYGYKLGI